jgi:hypothetical protein
LVGRGAVPARPVIGLTLCRGSRRPDPEITPEENMSRNYTAPEELLAQLQREVRRLRRAVACTVVMGCIGGSLFFLVCCAQQTEAQATRESRPETIRVETLQIVDRGGKVVGEFSTAYGQPILRMMDADGEQRIFLGMARVNSGDNGPMLTMSHKKDWLRVRGPSRYQHPEVRLHGEDDKGTAEAELRVIGSAPALWLIKGEQRVWQAP